MKPLEHGERILALDPHRPPRNDAGRSRPQLESEPAGLPRIDELKVQRRERFARTRIGGIGDGIEEIGQVQVRFDPRGREAHRIGRRLIDPGDAKLSAP